MSMPHLRPLTLLILLLSPLAASAAAAQDRVLDRGTLSIMQGDRVVGYEEFVVHRGRRSGATDGYTISSTARYPADRPTRSITAVVELGPDSLPAATALEAEDGELQRVLMVFAPRRVTVRRKTRGGESAREFPGGGTHLILCDSLFGYHAIAPGSRGEPVRSITLRGGERSPADVTDHGVEPTPVGTEQLPLRRIGIAVEGRTRYLWYDQAGRLIKLAIPHRGLTALRTTP
jgi:hypothetical protein